jgi:hypothetical protein
MFAMSGTQKYSQAVFLQVRFDGAVTYHFLSRAEAFPAHPGYG